MSSPTERQFLPSQVGSDSALLACLPFPALMFDVKSFSVVESNAYFCMENNMLLLKLLAKYDFDFLDSDDIREITSKLKTEKQYSVHKLTDNINEITTFEITFNLLPDGNYAFMFLNRLSIHQVDEKLFVTEQKQTEQQLKKQSQLLKEIVDSTYEGIGLIDFDYKITFCNSSFASFFSLKEDALIGEDLPKLLKEYRSEAIAEFEINKYGLETSFELSVSKNDAKDQYFLFRAIPRFDSKSNYIGSFVTILNISELKHIEKELILAKDKAQEADQLKSSFLTNMSHEIRTPMNSILGFSSMLKLTALSKAKRDQYLDIIFSKGKHLMSIISDIIDITKIEEHQIHLSYSPCDLNHLMEDLFETYSHELVKSNKQVKLILNSSYRTKNDYAIIDSIRLIQVLSNLLNNSLKFTEKGYIELGLKYLDNKSLFFYVKDTGIGVLPEFHEIIFQRFRQADESFTRIFGGAGLGLAICKGLINLMGGKIWVESDGVCGSTFNFTLPVADIENFPISEVGGVLLNQKWHEKAILIIEDDQASFQLLNEFLEMNNCKVIHAENGKDALVILQENNFIDLILLDIQLPIMDGYQVARSIRNINPIIPIIAQTAHAFGSDRSKCKEAGCDDYLAKPIQFDRLEAILNSYLS